ncbi:methylated-DNA--[protein]-cysteine S-methyltransferase [Actinomyces trachealis]|uniref:methylated-DNA--[protein]-cysteine S-methyltransferase n=1 Tax=Actinomyces trachealis TaxID=2763540 RepID=UPI001FD4E467|nr:methylated-DNA--[protein]-cysteine S-methyltransferase [Actinomyces trachealis]
MTQLLAPYRSPLGPMTLAVEVEVVVAAQVQVAGAHLPAGGVLVGAWFDGQAHDRAGIREDALAVSAAKLSEPPVLVAARSWLDQYFRGGEPGEPPALALRGTPFQQQVWSLLRQIPRGQTCTYGQLAQAVAAATGAACSARAVGGAVGRNPISVIVPCHRVVGADGQLTGYAGGTARKKSLLRLEGAVL